MRVAASFGSSEQDRFTQDAWPLRTEQGIHADAKEVPQFALLLALPADS